MDKVQPRPLQLITADWAAPAKVRALTTCRSGGNSLGPYGAKRPNGPNGGTGRRQGSNDSGVERFGLNLGQSCGDDAERVKENRQILRRSLPGEPRWLRQVHGTEVCEFDAPALEAGALEAVVFDGTPTTADAAISFQPGVVLSILTADCLPIFMCNQEADAIGICHAGWRGLAAGIVEVSAAKLRQRRASSKGWIAHLGPAIGPDAFEVGEDVRAAFCATHAADDALFVPLGTPGKYLANLYELASRRLRDAGFQTITGGAYCTVRDEELFYSHRRDRQTGRMASLIWIEK